MEDWYSRPAGHILKELETSPEGLSGREAARRLEREGPNELEAPRGPGLLARLLGQLRDPMILVLLAAAGLSLAASGGEDWLDGVIILVIVGVNAVISITQEDHAQHLRYYAGEDGRSHEPLKCCGTHDGHAEDPCQKSSRQSGTYHKSERRPGTDRRRCRRRCTERFF